MDGIYGLVVVFVSLVGFISLVWLKDQLGNGGGPPWLANDPAQGEIDRQRPQEVQDRGEGVAEGMVEEEQGEANAPQDVTETMRLEMEMQENREQLDLLVEARFKQQIEAIKQSILEHINVAQLGAMGPANVGEHVPPFNAISENRLAELRDEELQLEYEQRIHREMALRYVVQCPKYTYSLHMVSMWL